MNNNLWYQTQPEISNRVVVIISPTSQIKFDDVLGGDWVQDLRITLQNGVKWVQKYGAKVDLKFQLGVACLCTFSPFSLPKSINNSLVRGSVLKMITKSWYRSSS